MKKRLAFNKIVASLFLIVFVYHSFGYFLLYFPVRSVVKQIVQNAIEKDEINRESLVKLVFSKKDFIDNKYDLIWEKPGKEFRYNNKMYDVKSIEQTNNEVTLICYEDSKENVLESLFNVCSDYNKKDKNRTTVNFDFAIGFNIERENQINYNVRSTSKLPILVKDRCNKNFIIETPTPPPKNCETV